MAATFKQQIQMGCDDTEQMSVAVIETFVKALVHHNPKLCIPAFLEVKDHTTVKFSVGTDDHGIAWKDVMAVMNGEGTILCLRFRILDTLNASFRLPFSWHTVHVGDSMTFKLAGSDAVQIAMNKV